MPDITSPDDAPAYRMQTGYAFEPPPSQPYAATPDGWREPCNDDWDLVAYTADGTETPQGERLIDGARCTVFLCADGVYRAQLTHLVRGS